MKADQVLLKEFILAILTDHKMKGIKMSELDFLRKTIIDFENNWCNYYLYDENPYLEIKKILNTTLKDQERILIIENNIVNKNGKLLKTT